MSETTHSSQSVGRDSVEPINSESHGSTESRPTEDIIRPPQSLRDLALQVTYAIVRDIHIKGSGLIFFGLLGYGALHPSNKDQCEQLAALAGTYLFGAAINRK